MDTFRPEYLDAVAASRWNLWLIPLFLSAPLLLLVPVLRRWHWAVIASLALVGAVATWFSVFGYSETIWKTMEAHAQTVAEIEDVTSDTGRVFGPFLLGTPFALFYAGAWWGISLTIRAIAKRVRRAQRLEPPRITSLIIAAALALAAGCSRAPVITIKNQSSLTLSNIVMSGSGFANRIASIPPGAEHRLTVRPSGELGVQLARFRRLRHGDCPGRSLEMGVVKMAFLPHQSCEPVMKRTERESRGNGQDRHSVASAAPVPIAQEPLATQ